MERAARGCTAVYERKNISTRRIDGENVKKTPENKEKRKKESRTFEEKTDGKQEEFQDRRVETDRGRGGTRKARRLGRTRMGQDEGTKKKLVDLIISFRPLTRPRRTQRPPS